MRRAILVTFALLLAACGLNRGDSPFEEQEFTDAGITVDVGSPSPDAGLGQGPGAGTMAGTWILAHEDSTCVIGQEQLTLGVYRVVIEELGDGVLEEEYFICDLELSPVLGLEVFVPQTTLDSANYVSVGNGLVSRPTVGGSYLSPQVVGLWGVEFDDPLKDPMPLEGDEESVVDADEDGNPGVTFGVQGSDCERWVGQRSIVQFHGFFEAPNKLSGRSLTIAETAVYGSSKPLCGASPTIQNNDDHSRFVMYRIDGAGGSFDADTDGDGTISCEEVRPLVNRAIDFREPNDENCE